IRAYNETGFQTCALPISHRVPGGVGPFDGVFVTHLSAPICRYVKRSQLLQNEIDAKDVANHSKGHQRVKEKAASHCLFPLVEARKEERHVVKEYRKQITQ